jgi:hypothetical protein
VNFGGFGLRIRVRVLGQWLIGLGSEFRVRCAGCRVQGWRVHGIECRV